MCVLMLRGPQTPGELKGRAGRMHAFAGLESVQQTLALLIERGLAARLERRPGQKEERYAQRLADVESASDAPAQAAHAQNAAGDARGDPPEEGSAATPGDGGQARVEQMTPLAELQQRVAVLEREVAALRAAVGGGLDGQERTVMNR
jgi:uncharacterized protein YceH (UPF0502 family)